MLISWHGKLEFNINSAPLSFGDCSFVGTLASSLSPSTIRLHRRTLSFGNVANLSFALRSKHTEKEKKSRTKKQKWERMSKVLKNENSMNEWICYLALRFQRDAFVLLIWRSSCHHIRWSLTQLNCYRVANPRWNVTIQLYCVGVNCAVSEWYSFGLPPAIGFHLFHISYYHYSDWFVYVQHQSHQLLMLLAEVLFSIYPPCNVWHEAYSERLIFVRWFLFHHEWNFARNRYHFYAHQTWNLSILSSSHR